MNLTILQNEIRREKNFIRIINKMIQNYIRNPKGDLDLFGLSIDRLPKNLKYIDGCLEISCTDIVELPKSLHINGSLICKFTSITELPNDINIEYNLYCISTPLSENFSKKEIKKMYSIKGEIYY